MAFLLLAKDTRQPLLVDRLAVSVYCNSLFAHVTFEFHFVNPSATSGNVGTSFSCKFF